MQKEIFVQVLLSLPLSTFLQPLLLYLHPIYTPLQCICNMGILAVPLMLQTYTPLAPPLTPLEGGAWLVWLAALLVEHRADLEKKAFARQCKKDGVKDAVCEVGGGVGG